VPVANQQVLKWWPEIKRIAAETGLDALTWLGLIDFESSGNPDAYNRSSKATGLGQVMPREAGPQFRDRPTVEQLKDPSTNLLWSARILKAGLDAYGSMDKALAAYLGAIDRNGNITNARDANGTDGPKYISEVRSRSAAYLPLVGDQVRPGAGGGGADPVGAAGGGMRGLLGQAGQAAQRAFTGVVPGGRLITDFMANTWSFADGKHRGIDLAGEAGDPVVAPTQLTIVDPGKYGLSKGYGRVAAGMDDAGNLHIFGHTAEGAMVAPGERVPAGATIATMGDHRNPAPGEASQGDHTHYEVRAGGDFNRQVDPRQFLAQTQPLVAGWSATPMVEAGGAAGSGQGQGAGAVSQTGNAGAGLVAFYTQQQQERMRAAQDLRRTMDSLQGSLVGLQQRAQGGDTNAREEIDRIKGRGGNDQGEIGRLQKRIEDTEGEAAQYAEAAAKTAAELATGKASPEALENLRAETDLKRAQIAQLEQRLAAGGVDPTEETALRHRIAVDREELRLRGLEMQQRERGQQSQIGVNNAQIARSEWEVKEGQALLGPTVQRTLASAGLDAAQANRVWHMLAPELETAWAELNRIQQLTPLEVERGAIDNDLQRARIEEARKLLPANLRAILARAGVDEQAITTATQMLPLQLADLSQQTKLRAAETEATGARTGLTREQERQARVQTDFELQRQQAWRSVQERIQANPNATADQINEWALGAATTLSDWTDAYRTQLETQRARSEQFQQTQQLQIGQQTADSNVRNQRMEEALGLEQNRVNEVNSVTQSLRPGQGGPMRRMAQLGAMAPLVGAEGLRDVAMQNRIGQMDLGPIQEGFRRFQEMVGGIRASAPDVRMAPTVGAPPPINVRFTPPGALPAPVSGAPVSPLTGAGATAASTAATLAPTTAPINPNALTAEQLDEERRRFRVPVGSPS
jgi:murein DD-endopeptidase MepM/ murein hydrolase activator NlpD